MSGLEELERKWRDDAQRLARGNDAATDAVVGTLIACADELAHTITAAEGEAVAWTLDGLYAIAVRAWDEHQVNCRVTTIEGSLRKAVEAIYAATLEEKV